MNMAITFTQKHFIVLAKIIKDLAFGGIINTNALMNELIETFEKDNPKFSRGKFIKACGNETYFGRSDES